MTTVKMVRYYLSDETVKDLEAGSGITLVSDKEKVTISASGGSGEANTASNLGTGIGLFTTKSGVNLPFKSLTAGTDIVLTPSSNDITIAVNAAAFATAAQGAKADTAVQPAALSSIAYTPADNSKWTGTAPTTLQQAIDRIAAALGPIA